MITVRIPVENIATVLATYTSLRLYRDTSPTGSFGTLVTTITLVAGQTLYSYPDAAGDANSVYQHEYYNTGTLAVSSRSPAYYPTGVTLLRLRLEAARECGAAFDSTCSATGTVTTLIDQNLQDMAVDTAFLESAYIYRPNAAQAGDKVRRVKKDGYTVAAYSLGVDRQWGIAPASGELYHIFNLFPPIDRPGVAFSWDRIIRNALANLWFADWVDLGPGDGTNWRFSLSSFPELNRRTIRGIKLRKTLTNGTILDADMGLWGRFWELRENAGENFLDLSDVPRTDQNVIVECIRRDPNVYQDTDVTLAPFRTAVTRSAVEAFRMLNKAQPGKYAGELAMAIAAYETEREVTDPDDVVIGV